MSAHKKIGKIFTLLLGFPLFLGGLYFFYPSFKFALRSDSIKASVTNNIVESCNRRKNFKWVSYECFRTEVSFEYEGKRYKAKIPGTRTSAYPAGETLNLSIDPRDPYKVRTFRDLWTMPIVLFLPSFIFGSIGLFLLLKVHRQNKQVSRLKSEGKSIRAKVISIDHDHSITVDGKNPFILSAEFSLPSLEEPVVAQISELWRNPKLTGEIGDDGTVEVRYDPTDPRICTVILRKKRHHKVG
jgi:hypothetical protein